MDERDRRVARKLYAALFDADLPAPLAGRFAAAAGALRAGFPPAEVDDYLRRVSGTPDVEALEFAARLTGRLPLLPRELELMAYLGETRPENLDRFVGRPRAFLPGAAGVAATLVRSAAKAAYGLWLLGRGALG